MYISVHVYTSMCVCGLQLALQLSEHELTDSESYPLLENQAACILNHAYQRFEALTDSSCSVAGCVHLVGWGNTHTDRDDCHHGGCVHDHGSDPYHACLMVHQLPQPGLCVHLHLHDRSSGHLADLLLHFTKGLRRPWQSDR